MLSVAGDTEDIAWSSDGFRLIPSRFPPVSVYDGLVAEDRIEALVEVENRTNPRLHSMERLMGSSLGLSADSPRLQNWNHAPFAYANPEGSRFFPPERPCLELSDSRQTALAVSIARRETFLGRTSEAPTGLDMRMLKTPLNGNFKDLRSIEPSLPEKDRWKIGERVSEDADGILFRPAERPTATCLAILKSSVLGRSVQTVHYRYVWNGKRITVLYAFDNDGTKLAPEALSGATDVLAA